MTTLIGAYRWALLGLSFPPAYAWAALLIWGVVLVAGIRTFFRRQYELIDYL
jgi:hypothetical protein